jgi:uncharacterized protein (UPF0147 family)
MSRFIYEIRFKFPPQLCPRLDVAAIKDHSNAILQVRQDSHSVRLRSETRFEDRSDAERALACTMRGLELLGPALGIGIRDFGSGVVAEDAPAAPSGFTLIVEPDWKPPLEHCVQVLNKLPQVPDNFRTASALFDDSCCVEDRSVAALLRVIGIEVLCPTQQSPPEVLAAICELIGHLDQQQSWPEEVRTVVRLALNRARSISIREAVRRQIAEHVPEAKSKAVNEIYDVRSDIAHGRSVDRNILRRASHNAQEVLRCLILRGLGLRLSQINILDS